MLPVKSLEDFAAEHAIKRIHTLKIDAEGLEWDVLSRSKMLGHIDIIIMAYEDKWSADTYYAAYPTKTRGAAASVDEMETPSLKQMVAFMTRHDYRGFLLGTPTSCDSPPELLPLTPWNDKYELGWNPRAIRRPWTWYDVVFIHDSLMHASG